MTHLKLPQLIAIRDVVCDDSVAARVRILTAQFDQHCPGQGPLIDAGGVAVLVKPRRIVIAVSDCQQDAGAGCQRGAITRLVRGTGRCVRHRDGQVVEVLPLPVKLGQQDNPASVGVDGEDAGQLRHAGAEGEPQRLGLMVAVTGLELDDGVLGLGIFWYAG